MVHFVIVIPDSVDNIYWEAFYNCQNLKNIHIKGKRCRLWTNCFKETNNIEYPISYEHDDLVFMIVNGRATPILGLY